MPFYGRYDGNYVTDILLRLRKTLFFSNSLMHSLLKLTICQFTALLTVGHARRNLNIYVHANQGVNKP